MLRWGRATLLVLRAGSPLPVDRSAVTRAAACGVHVVFVHQVDALVRMLDIASVAAVAICPPQATMDSLVIAAGLRRRAPELPVAVVLGPSRVDGDPARILWVAEHAVPPAITRTVGDIVELQRGDRAVRGAAGEVAVGPPGPAGRPRSTDF